MKGKQDGTFREILYLPYDMGGRLQACTFSEADLTICAVIDYELSQASNNYATRDD